MSKKNNIGLNYIYNAAFKVLVVLTPLITAPYLSRVLGVEGIGTYSYTSSVVAIFALFSALGTYIYGSREIAFVQEDRKAYSRLFWDVEALSLITVLLVSIVYGIFVALQTKYIKVYAIQVITLLAVANNISWLFQGLEEFKKITIVNAIFRILSVVYIFTFIKSEDHLLLYVLGLVALEFMGNAVLWVYLPAYVDRPHLKELHPFRHLKGTFLLFIPTIGTTIYTIFDKTMIGIFTTTTVENGYYEQAMKLPKTALTLVTAMETVMIPRVGNLFVNGQEDEMKELLYKVYRFIWFLCLPLAFGLFSIADIFVPWFYGPGYEKAALLLKILAFVVVPIGLSNITGVQYLMATKRENKASATIFSGAMINLVLNLILIPKIYSVGAAIASVIAECCITFMQLFLVRKELSVSRIFSCGVNYMIAVALMTLALHFLEKLFVSGLLGTVAMVGVGAAVYLLVLIVLRDPMLKDLLAKRPKKG